MMLSKRLRLSAKDYEVILYALDMMFDVIGGDEPTRLEIQAKQTHDKIKAHRKVSNAL